MPGKVNPVLPEVVNQLYFLVSGNNLTIEQAAQASQLELGAMFPLIAQKLLESLILADEVLFQFSRICVSTIEVDGQRCKALLESSTAYATLLVPRLGYDVVAAVVKEARDSDRSIREVILKRKLMSLSDFQKAVRAP